jgi:hypothetical protein
MAGSQNQVRLNRLTDGTWANAVAPYNLTTYPDATGSIAWVSMTKPFVETSQTQVGLGFILAGGGVVIAKIDPTAATKEAAFFDTDYRLQTSVNGGTPSFFYSAASSGNLALQQDDDGGVGYFYAAYRKGTSLEVIKLPSTKASDSAHYTTPWVSTVAAAMNDATNASVHLSVGRASGALTPGVVYGTNGGSCAFRRFSSDLSTSNAAVTIEATRCYFPKVFYVAKTGRFLVVYALGSDSTPNRMTIQFKEVTTGATDTAGSSTIVVEDLYSTNGASEYADMLKFDADYDSVTGFVALFYRVGSVDWANSATQRVHGFQAPWL